MKYQKNYLGFNKHLEEILNEKLKLLNKSLKELVKNNKNLSNIKNISFYFEDTIENTPFLLKLNIQLRSGEDLTLDYFKPSKEDSVSISDSEIQSYYGESKKNDIINFLNDNYGSLDYSFLKVHEPILLNQLCQDYIINLTPNSEYGLEVTTEDLDFLIKIANNQV